MARWGGSSAEDQVGRRPLTPTYLYVQCDCENFRFGHSGRFTAEVFDAKLRLSRHVYVAKDPGHQRGEDGRYAWKNEIGQYEFVTYTKDGYELRQHHVYATLDGGIETPWVCKHAICVARFIGRRLWNARHLYIHLQGDPHIAKRLRDDKYFTGEDSEEFEVMMLTRHVQMTGWGFYDYRSTLFDKT